jgi:hypothetical protein
MEDVRMVDLLLSVVLVIAFSILAVAVLTLRSSRRSEALGEDRYEMLRDHNERLELLREERQLFVDELKRESQERQRFMENARPHVAEVPDEEHRLLEEELEQERQAREESARRAEQQEQERQRLEEEHRLLEEELEQERQAREESARRAEQQEGDEQSRIEQQAERVAQDLQQLRGDLEREREERLEAERLAEQLGQELRRLERELSRSKGGSPSRRQAASPWWRKPIPFVALLLGTLIVWLTSLVVALNFLNP